MHPTDKNPYSLLSPGARHLIPLDVRHINIAPHNRQPVMRWRSTQSPIKPSLGNLLEYASPIDTPSPQGPSEQDHNRLTTSRKRAPNENLDENVSKRARRGPGQESINFSLLLPSRTASFRDTDSDDTKSTSTETATVFSGSFISEVKRQPPVSAESDLSPGNYAGGAGVSSNVLKSGNYTWFGTDDQGSITSCDSSPLGGSNGVKEGTRISGVNSTWVPIEFRGFVSGWLHGSAGSRLVDPIQELLQLVNHVFKAEISLPELRAQLYKMETEHINPKDHFEWLATPGWMRDPGQRITKWLINLDTPPFPPEGSTLYLPREGVWLW